MTLPDLILLDDYGGDWGCYEDVLYAQFDRDILQHDLRFRGAKVTARRIPEHMRKWAGFWHLISGGHVEDERTPDLRRCERLAWIRWIIENEAQCSEVDVWHNQRGREKNTLLWFREDYLVVLAERKQNVLLKTAYCTNRAHTVQKLRKERDEAQNTFQNG